MAFLWKQNLLNPFKFLLKKGVHEMQKLPQNYYYGRTNSALQKMCNIIEVELYAKQNN